MRNHITSIYKKLGLEPPGNAVTAALKIGWLVVPDEYTQDHAASLPNEAASVDGVVQGLAHSISDYASSQVERAIGRNEELLRDEAIRRQGERMKLARVRRTA